MDLDTKKSSGMMNGFPPPSKEERKVGPIVGALVVILIIIVVTLYFFGKRLNTQNPEMINFEMTQAPATTTESVSSVEIQLMNDELDDQMRNVDYSF
jgi:hypothetical protein